ncbi:MAG TPA: enoyl-CoA hydratase-related protein [Anaerolineales bacterium]|nr:enoyl-CoA hydratase-related protein [Anaerolineales bacterium]
MSENQFVYVERDGPVAIVTLSRPEALNALNAEMLADLCEALEVLDADPQVRTIVLTGSGRAFAAGADIKVLAEYSSLDVLRANTQSYWQRLRNLNKPLIAAVNGYAYGGGCELALQCDLIVASETASFAQPEIKLGIMPGAGGTQRLARAIGPYRAMEMILLGEPLTALDAYAYGLVNRLVPPENCVDEAVELARQIADRPPIAVRLARQAVRHGLENTMREGLEVERRNYTLLFDTHDQAEGMSAFMEKRKPRFRGA